MFPSPATPTFPTGYSAISSTYVRYEDVTMDGRLIPIAAPAGLAGLWREVLVKHPGARNALQLGILPILTRLTIDTTDTSFRLDMPVETRNGFALAHDRTPRMETAGLTPAVGNDEVTRLFMNVWCEIHGVAGRLGRSATAGGSAMVGRVFAEHTFTRPLAPPEQRRVVRLGVDGYPDVPDERYAQPAATTASEAPEGATWLDELAPDPVSYVFTLDQTDSNQHVNSLVYVRIFMEAVNRRLAASGRSLRVRSRSVDIAYRKPCFAGDAVSAQLRVFELAGSLGAAGTIIGSDGKPRCYVRVALGN